MWSFLASASHLEIFLLVGWRLKQCGSPHEFLMKCIALIVQNMCVRGDRLSLEKTKPEETKVQGSIKVQDLSSKLFPQLLFSSLLAFFVRINNSALKQCDTKHSQSYAINIYLNQTKTISSQVRYCKAEGVKDAITKAMTRWVDLMECGERLTCLLKGSFAFFNISPNKSCIFIY